MGLITDYGARGFLKTLLASFTLSESLLQCAIICPSNLPEDAAESYPWLSTAPSMEQWLDQRKENDVAQYVQLVPNLKFANGLKVKLSLINNDKTDQVKSLITQVAQTYPLWMLQLLAKQINNGTAANSFDGVTFFNSSHTWGKTGTFSNVFNSATTGIAGQVTAFEAALAINKGINLMRAFPDDQGRIIKNETMTKVVVVYQAGTVNASAIATALATMHGGMLGSGAGAVNNPLEGVVSPLGGQGIEIVNCPSGLVKTGNTVFSIFRHRDDLGKGLLFQENKDEMMPNMITSPDSTYVVKNDAWFIGLRVVGNAAFGLPNDAIQGTFV